MLEHVAARCTVACPSKEPCRRCGSAEHLMKECNKKPRCAMCLKHGGINVRHITGSLACPMVRLGVRNIRKVAQLRSYK